MVYVGPYIAYCVSSRASATRAAKKSPAVIKIAIFLSHIALAYLTERPKVHHMFQHIFAANAPYKVGAFGERKK